MRQLQEAEATRAELRTKLDEARTALDAIDARRKAISFDAHTVGGEAKKSLDKLNLNRVAQLAMIESLEVAHGEASRRVADAERQQALLDLAEQAALAFSIAGGLGERGRKIDEALAIVATESSAYESDLHTLQTIGCTHPHAQQLASAGTRALMSALMGSPLKQEHMPPRERKSFAEISAGYARVIEAWAEPRRLKTEEAA